MKVPKSTVASIILKWKKFRVRYPVKLSNQGIMALIKEVTKHLIVSLAELKKSCVESSRIWNFLPSPGQP